MSAYATTPLVSKTILDGHDNGATVKFVKIVIVCMQWAKIYILRKETCQFSPD